ncbi:MULTISPECIES: hypothetical protein [Pandoraea]|uniref:Uncharacterized protein n=1 Tax=Pandoraea communis TaxID=2508297 RepID=A0A5E4XXB0_9BURK|nr:MULTISPECIES: hypothetical protein [Pandoraea]ALS66590.1 hypothetical protein AT395_17815 [Pandoraea apista]CFB61437.1 hypothetical protein LMG16407_01496 [Pandoraea apista]VVE40980.1 hypothetical protein PCO31110_04206 [Pandoraea communis]
MPELNGTASVADAIALTMRSYFSINHLATAAHQAQVAARIEAAYGGFNAGEAVEHKGAVSGSIFMSVAGVEASINEFFSDCADAHMYHLVGLEEQAVDRLARGWNATSIVEKASILEKFQFACLLADKAPLDLGTPAAQDLAIGIDIRNALMHYKPQSVDLPLDGTSVTVVGSWKSIERKLKGRPKLTPNPFASEAQPEFPYRVLGYECAKRTLSGALSFLELFASHLGLTRPPFQNICSELRAGRK